MNLFSGAMQPHANYGNFQSFSFLRYSLETIILLLKYLYLRMADATSLPFFLCPHTQGSSLQNII